MVQLELAIVDGIKQPDAGSWRLAGIKVCNTLDMDVRPYALFVSGSGVSWMNGQARKFLFKEEWQGMQFYRHVRVLDDILAFRPVASKVVNIIYAGLQAAGHFKVEASNALTGTSYGTFVVGGADTVKGLRAMIVKKLMQDMVEVSPNTVIKIVAGVKVMPGNAMLKALIPEHDKKAFKSAAKPMKPADSMIQTKLKVKKIVKNS